ncbi:MAG TPA: recombinase RecA [Candidatus Marinimicrobia bacterium]|jgi:recombination protein RecA|nr:recombinase RecA [Candidatus Neomarinimicrobiota bacterium]
MSDKRIKALELAKAQIEKQYRGEELFVELESDSFKVRDNVISTGCLSLDLALGVGGIPKGRIIELYGPEGSGKTTLALHIVAEAQKAGGIAAYIDMEHALDTEYMKKLGINTAELIVSQPSFGEQALDMTDTLIRSNALDLIIIDSVAALVPKAELDGEMGDHFVGLHARLMSQAMRKLTGTVKKTDTCLIFINQIREKIGVMFGNPETTTGGRALKFYSSVRMEIRRVTAVKEGTEFVGARVRVKIVKNKVAPPFKSTEFDIMYGEGISYVGDIIDLAVEGEIIQKTGAWYAYNDEKIGQGRENAKTYLQENPDVLEKIVKNVRIFVGLDEGEEEAAA